MRGRRGEGRSLPRISTGGPGLCSAFVGRSTSASGVGRCQAVLPVGAVCSRHCSNDLRIILTMFSRVKSDSNITLSISFIIKKRLNRNTTFSTFRRVSASSSRDVLRLWLFGPLRR